jgi:hypothetical protein
MTTIIIICILTGAILGLRFNVLVLVPTIGLALVVAAVVGAAQGDQIWLAAARLAVIATTIQIGYLGGLFSRTVQTAGAFGQGSFVEKDSTGRFWSGAADQQPWRPGRMTGDRIRLAAPWGSIGGPEPFPGAFRPRRRGGGARYQPNPECRQVALPGRKGRCRWGSPKGRGDITGSASSIFNYELPAEMFRQRLSHKTRKNIGRAASASAFEHAHRSRRIRLPPRHARYCRYGRSARGKAQKSTAWMLRHQPPLVATLRQPTARRFGFANRSSHNALLSDLMCHSPLIPAVLMIGHHFSISALTSNPSDFGVCSDGGKISIPMLSNRAYAPAATSNTAERTHCRHRTAQPAPRKSIPNVN